MLPRDGAESRARRASAPGGPAAGGSRSGQQHDPDDGALITRVAGGDAEALEALYARYGTPCYSLARRILVDPQLAQDVVQEVFLTLWRDASRFDAAKAGFRTWLLSITHHKSVDAVRREENQRKRRNAVEVLETRASASPAVDAEVWSVVRGERVREALSQLPEPQREALVLAYFGGYTQREIAGLTATPLGTVKTRMLAGMRRMRGGLDGTATEDSDLPSDGEGGS